MIRTVHCSVRIRYTEYLGPTLRDSNSHYIGAASVDGSLHLCRAGNLEWSEALDRFRLHRYEWGRNVPEEHPCTAENKRQPTEGVQLGVHLLTRAEVPALDLNQLSRSNSGRKWCELF